MQEQKSNKIDMRKKLPTNPLEKRLILTDKKITSMLEKIQSDIIKLEVEWLHLRAMSNVTEPEVQSQENKSTDFLEEPINFDDVNVINSAEIKFQTDSQVTHEFDESDSEESELEDNENIFV